MLSPVLCRLSKQSVESINKACKLYLPLEGLGGSLQLTEHESILLSMSFHAPSPSPSLLGIPLICGHLGHLCGCELCLPQAMPSAGSDLFSRATCKNPFLPSSGLSTTSFMKCALFSLLGVSLFLCVLEEHRMHFMAGTEYFCYNRTYSTSQ